MPIYEYQCKKCGHQTEILQKFSDPPLTKCEACNGKMKKLISQNTFHLKGSGWYVTDYAKKSSNTSAPSKKAKNTPQKGKSSSASTSGSTTSAD